MKVRSEAGCPQSTSGRGRWSLGVRHPEQVAAETDAPCEDGIDDHPLHPAVPETEDVIRNEQAEGSERTDPEQDRHIGERRTKDPEREDGGQAREEEREKRDDPVEEAEGLRDDANPDGSDSREEDRDHKDWVLECPEEEPRRREDRDAEQNDRRVKDRGARPDPEVADVVRRDAVSRIHRFGDDHADRELRGPDEEEQARPLSVLEAHVPERRSLALNHFEVLATSRRICSSSTSSIALSNHARAWRYFVARSSGSLTNARPSSRRTTSGGSSRYT